LEVEIAQGREGGDGGEGGAVKTEKWRKTTFSPRSKVFIPLQPGVSGPGPEYPGNPEFPGPTSEIPLPLRPASRFSRNLILVEIWKIACVIY
jgi:hypothetical protein